MTDKNEAAESPLIIPNELDEVSRKRFMSDWLKSQDDSDFAGRQVIETWSKDFNEGLSPSERYEAYEDQIKFLEQRNGLLEESLNDSKVKNPTLAGLVFITIVALGLFGGFQLGSQLISWMSTR